MERITDRQTSYIILSQCNKFHIFTSFSRISICFKVQESLRINMSISKIAQGKWSYLFNFCCEWKVQGSLGINMSRSKIAQGKWSYLFNFCYKWKSARILVNKYEQIEDCSRQVIIFIRSTNVGSTLHFFSFFFWFFHLKSYDFFFFFKSVHKSKRISNP